jgi:hypothetical protein
MTNEDKTGVEEGEEQQESERLERNTKRVKLLTPFAGATAAMLIYSFTLAHPFYNLGRFAGESVHGGRVSKAVLSLGSEKGVPQRYLGILPADVRTDYERYHDAAGFERISRAAQEVLGGMQRGAEHFPGANSGPVKDLRGLKGKIIEATKRIIPGQDKEQITKTNTKQYQENWNRLSELLAQAILKRAELESEMSKYSEKLVANEVSGADAGGRSGLIKIVQAYNGLSELVESISRLRGDVKVIYDGVADKEYFEALKTAGAYGLKPFDGTLWGAGTVGLGALVSAGAGYWAGRKLRSLAGLGYKVAAGLSDDTQELYREFGPFLKAGAKKVDKGFRCVADYVASATISVVRRTQEYIHKHREKGGKPD